MAAESKIQKKIITYLESQGCYIVKVISATKSGVPDILACYHGQFIGIEVKTPSSKNNVSELQKYNLRCIEESGGRSCIAWDVLQVEDFLNTI